MGAYEEGVAAFEDGFFDVDCPYGIEDWDEKQQWLCGFDEGRYEECE